MAVEELEKSMATTEIEDQRKDDDDLEEGEIIDDNSNAEKPSKSIATTHPLENAWTFWFDNLTAKSKQAAWGSSIRPIYIFSTVEEFWSSKSEYHCKKLIEAILLMDAMFF
ncbi:eukaryotic translation initiation factor 4E-1-like [Chenopodium quinoa]|uniref:eukaryotic translation initiation factor 4E-1-like n=1 Tax=Chenopodium quinoa TaxID=63459 RepID=UPI000B7990BB|nr:eukaryotic translation initiation factor 4E-1-like [Chenopodium quinoa]